MVTETTIDKSVTEAKIQTTLHCTVGMMAYNEEANIGRLLQALLDQQLTNCEIVEMIVVASGCTDNTEAVVQRFCAQYPQIKLLVQPRREGKASAINLFLRQAQSDILVMESADTIPEPTAVQRLLEPFADPEVGMTGAHPVPINDPRTFMGFTAYLLWELHHQIALRRPKLGEMTAYRRLFHRIPHDSAVDEVSVEALIHGQGYKLRYVPEAIVRNCGPQTVKDFLRQRRRIYAGHLKVRYIQGYPVSTMKGSRILFALARCWQWNWRFILWTPAVIALEVYGRCLGWVDFIKRRSHAIWEIATTTKEMMK